MKLSWIDDAWDDYLLWQKEDKAIFSKINALIKEIKRAPFEGIGKPELLKHELAGVWSRRITKEHRLLYRVLSDEIEIIECKGHY